MTRVATPDDEERLVTMALHATGAQLEKIVRKFRMVQQPEQPWLQRERTFRATAVEGGLFKVVAYMTGDEVEPLRAAMEDARAEGVPEEIAAPPTDAEHVSAEAPADERAAAPPRLSAVDALLRMAEFYLQAGHKNGDGEAGQPARTTHHRLLVHLEQDLMGPDGQMTGYLDDGSRVSAETFRRLSCDCGLDLVKQDANGRPLDVGRRTRTIAPALHRALWSRDRGCRFPGCTHTRWVHGHHIQHWAHGGATSLDNLVLLCSAHHRLVHEEGFGVRMHNGAPSFTTPDGVPILSAPQAAPTHDSPVEYLSRSLRDENLDLVPDTNLCGWDGTAVQWDAVIQSLVT